MTEEKLKMEEEAGNVISDRLRSERKSREYDDSPPPTSCEVPHGIGDSGLWRDVVRYQFLYSFAGLTLGLASIIGGIILFLRGVTGSTSWVAKIFGLESNITDAAPGAILFIVGLFMVFVTRFVVKTKH